MTLPEIIQEPWISLQTQLPPANVEVEWYDAMFDKVMVFALADPAMHDGDFSHWKPVPRRPKEWDEAWSHKKAQHERPEANPVITPIYLITRYIKACGDNGPKLQKILDDHQGAFQVAKGSMHKHQAWEGGYLQHVADTMTIARRELNRAPKSWEVPFTWSSVVLVLFLHDIHKPFMQKRMAEDPEMQPWTEVQRNMFRGEIIAEYDITLTREEISALIWIHGEGDGYHPEFRIMNELCALCHAADILSARLWWNRNKPADK